MEALGVTASVIAIATLAAQSAKAAYEVIDGLVEAPQAIANSRTLLLGTQNTLDTLNGILKTDQDNQAKSESVLQLLTLDKTLGSTRELCVKFSDTITKYTRRSTDLRFSNRDRILVNLHESQIDDFNKQLSDCQQTISLIISTIVFGTSTDVQQLSGRFEAQEKALVTLITKFSSMSIAPETLGSRALDSDLVQNTGGEEQDSLQRTAILRDTCQAALQATKAIRTGQVFGDMYTDQSMAMQGIVGQAQEGVDQSFGKLTAKNQSRAFQGQMDASSFAQMFNTKG